MVRQEKMNGQKLKIGVPVNIIFIFLVLLIGDRGNWWFEEITDDVVRNYIVHISNSDYIL